MAGQLLGESYAGGPLNGLAVTNTYDADLRRTSLSALSGATSLAATTYGYDNASRLLTVNDGNNNTATYSYLANSPLVGQIVFTHSGTTRMTTTKQYDYLNRLTQISSAPSGTGILPVSFNYAYNSANQRTQNTFTDGSHWVYQYDSLGQVTNGARYWGDGTPVAGQQYQYAFDTIGNRTQTHSGGDTNGLNLRLASYSANLLNQITNRTVPGTNDLVGAAYYWTNVTVNGQAADRKAEYFHSTVGTNNAASAAWLGATVIGAGVTNTGHFYVAQTPEQFRYDLDGNLTNDGHWAYVWDGENRLIGMTVNTNVGPQYQLTFAYDSQGRRIQKTVTTNGVTFTTYNFLYDGWNLVAVISPSSTLQSSYVWGSDLSGSPQGAGGVGGLLEFSYHGTSTTNAFFAYDGNGNVADLVNSADGTVVAAYDYGPFGEAIPQTGPMAKVNPFRFSTKYQDDESDLLYYGYRYYKPSSGIWISRDPISEVGFELMTGRDQDDADDYSGKDLNNYVIAGNTPEQTFDCLGLSSVGIYDGADPGGSGFLCYIGLCAANGTDFKKFATRWYDYQIDIRSIAAPWKPNLIKALVALKKRGVEIDEIGFIDHGFPGHQEIGDDWLNTVYAVGSQEQKDWLKFYKDLGRKGFSNSNFPKGDIELDGCNVAAGQVGIDYLQYIANKTGHPVYGFTGSVLITGPFSGPVGDGVEEFPDNWPIW